MSDLYDVDVLAWSEHQARLLHAHAAGEQTNEVPDWTNIIEELAGPGGLPGYAGRTAWRWAVASPAAASTASRGAELDRPHFIPTTIDLGPAKRSTRVSRNTAWGRRPNGEKTHGSVLHAANSQLMPAPHRQGLVPGQKPGNQP